MGRLPRTGNSPPQHSCREYWKADTGAHCRYEREDMKWNNYSWGGKRRRDGEEQEERKSTTILSPASQRKRAMEIQEVRMVVHAIRPRI